MKGTWSHIGVGAVLAALLPTATLADFPAATYSLSFDGEVATASSVLGGSPLTISQSSPNAGDYVAVR